MAKDTIEIPFDSFKKLVRAFGEELFKRSPDADKATEPLDMPFLDHMLELQLKNTLKKSKEK